MEKNIHKILIIDDNEDYRKLLMDRLKSLYPDADIKEYDILKYGLPPAKFDWENFDVLILDYYLGEEETGLDWFNKYKKTEYFPATVVITGMHSEDIAAHILESGVHYYINKKEMSKSKMYEGIEKALAVRASLIEEYKQHNNEGYDFDTFLKGYLIRTEELLMAEILKEAKNANCSPDEWIVDTVAEKESLEILKLNNDPTIREVKIGLLEIVAKRIKKNSL